MQAIFCRRRHLGSIALRAALWSSWSHCGIVTPDVTVIEATASRGVVERALEDFLAGVSRYSVRTIEVPSDREALAFARAQVGKRYDWAGVLGLALRSDRWDDDGAWFCSELLEAAAVAGGRRRFLYNARRVTPQHSWMVA